MAAVRRALSLMCKPPALHGYNAIASRTFSTSHNLERQLNKSPDPNVLPRCAGIPTMFRLPHQDRDTTGLDACFIGVPIDWGVSNRPGTRYGPRQIRCESALIRPFNPATGAAPYEYLNVADCGDVYVTPYDLEQTVDEIYEQFQKLLSTGCKTLAIGGDHTITYPILKAHKEKYGPVGLVHVDAHLDCADLMNNKKIGHGTTFRRAFEDGCLDPKRVVQIGIRGTGYSVNDAGWPKSQGFRVIPCREIYGQSLVGLMKEVREQMGDGPVYISFDIDGLDPSIAPGTGTPEIAGLNSMQALEIIQGCKGLNVVGGDLVEVSPPYDTTGNTSMTAANLLFEMLCVLPGIEYHQLPQ